MAFRRLLMCCVACISPMRTHSPMRAGAGCRS